MSQTLAPSVVTSRDPKGLKFMGIVGSAYDRKRLTQAEAQRVNEATGLADLIDGFIEENRRENKYAGEEVASSYLYPPEFRGPKPIGEQIASLAQGFGLDPSLALQFAHALPDLKEFVPEDALPWTGWFAVLWDEIAGEIDDPATRYCRAVQLVLEKIAASRSFKNWREGQIDTAHLKGHPRTLEAMVKIAEAQKGPIKIIAAQLGMRHRGRSTRRANECFVASEYGLNSLMGGSIAYTHPQRFVRWEELDMDLPGDMFSGGGGGRFGHAPYLGRSSVRLGFDARPVGSPSGNFGSGSGFLPPACNAAA